MDRATIVTPWERRITTSPDGLGGFILVEETDPDPSGANRRISSSLRQEDRIRLGIACLGQDLMILLGDFDAAVTGLREGRDVEDIAQRLSLAYAQFERLMDIKEGATNAP